MTLTVLGRDGGVSSIAPPVQVGEESTGPVQQGHYGAKKLRHTRERLLEPQRGTQRCGSVAMTDMNKLT